MDSEHPTIGNIITERRNKDYIEFATKIILSKWDDIKYYIRNNDNIDKRIKRRK